MAVLDTSAGNLVIKDVPHALDKDVRTLFTTDNLKNNRKKSKHSAIPELHLVSYYGDITGPKELNFRGVCMKRIKHYLKHIPFDKHPELKVNTAVIQTIFKSIEIMHISHYSFEFVLNVSNTSLLHDYKAPNDAYITSNDYLVGTYQRNAYQDHITEFISMGLTSAISITNHEEQNETNMLYEFYTNDFIQDISRSLSNVLWYDESCRLSVSIWYNIAQYTMDCLLPVVYTRSKDDEVLLNDGSLRLFLTGSLSGDGAQGTKTDVTLDPVLEMSAHIFSDIGRVVQHEYDSHHNGKKLKSEYDKWKKQGFKKRALRKPLNMDELIKKLRVHQHIRHDTINAKPLYYRNPNFKAKKKTNKHSYANTTAMASFKSFFSFGSKGKNGYLVSSSPHVRSHSEQISPASGGSYGSYADIVHQQQSKKKKGKTNSDWDVNDNYNWNNDEYGTAYVTVQSRFVMNKGPNMIKTKKSKSATFDDANKYKIRPRKDSMTMMRVKENIRNAYRDYLKEKGKPPQDIQSFVNFCKRKNIKKANWTLCKMILSETNVNKHNIKITTDVIAE